MCDKWLTSFAEDTEKNKKVYMCEAIEKIKKMQRKVYESERSELIMQVFNTSMLQKVNFV